MHVQAHDLACMQAHMVCACAAVLKTRCCDSNHKEAELRRPKDRQQKGSGGNGTGGYSERGEGRGQGRAGMDVDLVESFFDGARCFDFENCFGATCAHTERAAGNVPHATCDVHQGACNVHRRLRAKEHERCIRALLRRQLSRAGKRVPSSTK